MALAPSCVLASGERIPNPMRAPAVRHPPSDGLDALALQQKHERLEERLDEQAKLIALQGDRLVDLERIAPKEFEVVHYNVLADQAGKNTQPWFCYGAELTPDERNELHRRFYAKGKEYKARADKGWPEWAEGVLSPERIAAVEAYEARAFAWEARCEKLFAAVATHRCGCRERSPDIITLAECDHYDDFWQRRLGDAGYDSMWRKRPRPSSRDGCAIAWRRSTFELIAEGGFDFGKHNSATFDRTCAFALLRWRRDPTVRLLVATCHLERDPQSSDRLVSRGFQYGAIFRELLAFAGAHDAEDVPVVLSGDLNAKDCDELAGIQRTLVRILQTPTHPLLWSVMDAPTGPTSVTEEREMRIDYLLYQSSCLSITGVGDAKVATPIPDEAHPSDHLPVSARFMIKPHWARVQEDARSWLACVSDTTVSRPLSGDALRLAFAFFDKDSDGMVSPLELESAMQTLGFPGLDVNYVREALREAGCQAHPAEYGGWAMDLDGFVNLYTHGITRRSSAMARQLEKAFAAFDTSGAGMLPLAELRTALQRMASGPLDDERIDEVLGQLAGHEDQMGEGMVTISSFSRWMMSTYSSYLRDPSLVQDSTTKWTDFFAYNQ